MVTANAYRSNFRKAINLLLETEHVRSFAYNAANAVAIFFCFRLQFFFFVLRQSRKFMRIEGNRGEAAVVRLEECTKTVEPKGIQLSQWIIWQLFASLSPIRVSTIASVTILIAFFGESHTCNINILWIHYVYIGLVEFYRSSAFGVFGCWVASIVFDCTNLD